ncbi:ABC transporter ATP-binding protein [Streptomyces sp. SCSIO 30461]|uniref:ABC transporter ATP-binding protein n=1 Tax=Streptomyces sp. SCSIO 30461 TaxID=3118085 RepID=UPI0030D4302C
MGKADLSARAVLRRAIGGQRRDVLLGAALGACHQGGEALVPVLIGLAIEQGVLAGDPAGMLFWLGALGVVYIGLSFGFRCGAHAGERAAVTAAHLLRIELVGRVLASEGGADDGRLPGELANIATEDARRVGAATMALIVGTGAVVGLAVGAVALLRVSLALGLLVLLGAPLLLWAGHLLSKPLERRSETEQERAARASGVAADLVAGLRVLKGIGAEPAAVARYRGISRESLSATLRAARADAWQHGVVAGLTGVFIAVVALVGGRLAARGDIGPGELVTCVALALYLIGPLSEFPWVNAELAQGRASAARIAGVLSAEHAVPRNESCVSEATARRAEGRLRLRRLRYGPLRAVDIEIGPGETVGVVTTDAAAATALLHCLGRRADPDTGAVELDGRALSALDLADVRRAILVAEHDAELFEGTLLDNVTVAATTPDTGRAGPDAAAAILASGADEVVRTLPEGADTAVGARGRSLSGGQRQRVALARALAADAPVLILHEPTTAVDAVTEVRIAAGIKDIRKGRTTLLVTSSPALLAVTDRVVLLHEGRVHAVGEHAVLAQEHTGYRAAVFT